MELYHNVNGLDRLKSILESGFIFKDKKIIEPCVYMTRDFNYLTNRGIRMVFDYNKLKHNYKVKPFSYRGWCLLNKHKFLPKNDEMEERVLNDVNIIKTCIRIDIDKTIFNKLNFNHPLINHTINFKLKFNKC
jgi:hypothetical protein